MVVLGGGSKVAEDVVVTSDSIAVVIVVSCKNSYAWGWCGTFNGLAVTSGCGCRWSWLGED